MFQYSPNKKLTILVTGISGFIGSHLGKELKKQGHVVIGADWKFPEEDCIDLPESCDKFHRLDLRSYQNCSKVTQDVDQVFHLAANMGGMGHIQSNHSQCILDNALMDLHVLESCRVNGVKKIFYASSACAYPEFRQSAPGVAGLKESDAWPAQPQDAYGLEKLFAEEAYSHYSKDFRMDVRVARFHNAYGPRSTWKGGREKAPAAICRKVAASTGKVEIWGDGLQTRSFVYIDDLIEGILRMMACEDERVKRNPMNIGTEDMISINDLAKLIIDISGKDIEIVNVPGPEGVRGRNSDNDMMRSVLGWEPSAKLRDGIGRLYEWVLDRVFSAEDPSTFGTSVIVEQQMVPLETKN
jgi:GDP-D-mannose 3',5'-epimerase